MTNRTAPALVAVLVAVGTLAAVPAAALAAQTVTTSPTPTPAANESVDQSANDTVAPGAQLVGVVGVQTAEIEADVESRAYGIQVARAQSNGSRAAVAADRLASIEERLDAIERRQRALERARENGSMSRGEYRARVAALHARTQTVERLANQTNETVEDLPAETLREKGVNVTAIRTLRERANELSGPEEAAIARSIAGNDRNETGRPAWAGNRTDAGERGPPDRATGPGNRTQGQANASDGDRTRRGAPANASDGSGNASEANGAGGPPENGGGPPENGGGSNGGGNQAGEAAGGSNPGQSGNRP